MQRLKENSKEISAMFSDPNLIKTLMNELEPFYDSEINDTEKNMMAHEAISLQLARRIETIKQHLPKGNVINVISLGCGKIPHEYLALRANLPNVKINFTGIDYIDSNIQMAANIFKKISDVKFISCDASNLQELHTKLLINKCIPTSGKGFDLVIIRHPEILSERYSEAFKRMIDVVAPFLSAKEGRCLLTCFLNDEFEAIKKHFTNKQTPYFGLKSNFVFGDKGMTVDHGHTKAIIDAYTMIMGCEGKACTASLLAQHSLLAPGFDPHQVLLNEIKKYCKGINGLETVIDAVEKKTYDLALRKACNEGMLKIAEIILSFQPTLPININGQSTNGNTALDWAQTSGKMDEIVRDKLCKLLIDAGAVNKTNLDSLKKVI